MYNNTPRLTNFNQTSKLLIILISFTSLLYFTWWLDFNNAGNIYLYVLLVIGEIFHVFQAIGYAFTIFEIKKPVFQKIENYSAVDVFITVCGEPVDIVEKTVKAAVKMKYPKFNVYVLNDGYVAKKDNWKEINIMALSNGATPITRLIPGGYKAGNVNHALSITAAPYILIFDADHVPDEDFLAKTMGYFKDRKLALVQTPQYYENKDDNILTKSAWEQQELFFGPICLGKNASNSAFWCGTNAIVKREAIESIGGIPESNIAEDFLASLFIHQKGWKSLYLPEILARGLAPNSLKDYVVQQFRWARGSLEIIFKYNPLFKKGLTWKQKLQYLISSSYYLNGVIILIDALIPIFALSFNAVPVKAQTSDFIVYFVPFLASTIYLLIVSTNSQVTFSALQFSSSSFFIYLMAFVSTVFRINVKFEVTSKLKQTGNYLQYVIPHITYIVIGIISIYIAFIKHGITPSFINNASWVLFNIIMFSAYIKVAYPWGNLFAYKSSQLPSKDATSNQLIYDVVPEPFSRNPERDA
jgi:cellulose synthase (UDP-forming)